MFDNKNIFLSLTYKCNAFCKKCMTRYHVNLHKTMEIDTLDRFLELLRENNYRGTVSVGSGEPLLYPHLKYFVGELFGINPDVRLRLLTNGMALNGELPEELFSGRCKLGVTFDAFEQDQLTGLQKGVDIETVKSNVSRLAKKHGGSCFYLNYTIYRSNVDQLIPFCRFGIENGIRSIYATELMVFTGYESDLKGDVPIHDEHLKYTVKSACELLKANSIKSDGVDIFRSVKKAACYNNHSVSPIIDVDGKTAFCSGREDVYIGNIKDEDIVEKWRKHAERQRNQPGKWCSSCFYRPLENGTYRLPSTIKKGI